MRRVGIEPTT